MPFSANRAFKAKPRLMNEASGMYYKKITGAKVLDATSGLWCCNAGHGQERIHEAVKTQLDKMAYAPSFQTAHDLPFEFAAKLLSSFSPHRHFNQVFFTMCGSTAVDTAMKMALAYHKAKGDLRVGKRADIERPTTTNATRPRYN